jgi:plastocyanin
MEERTSGLRVRQMSQPALQRDRQGVNYGEERNVQKMHHFGLPPQRDGRVTIEPFSLWVLAVWGLIFFLVAFFSARRGADFSAANLTLSTPPPAQSTPQAVETDTASASTLQSTAAEANAPMVALVAMKNMKFSPPAIEIKKGGTVEWTNEDITPHTATSPQFDSGSLASDKSWKHTFNEAGRFPYGCTFHPEMKGVVIVK